MAGLTPLSEALEQVLAETSVLAPEEEIPIAEALGRTLAQDVFALVPVPNDDNSAMDGYALRAAESDQCLPVSQRIPAGHAGEPLAPGTAARIFTGAPVPEGADAVVMQENTELDDAGLRLTKAVAPGENIRPRGQDIAEGDLVMPAGRRLRGEDLGVLASVGCGSLRVRKPITVAILSTGDELVEPGTVDSLEPGQIFNSNRFTLSGLLAGHGFKVVDLGMVPDTPEDTARVLEQAAAAADCVISTGGVSVGEEDHVRNQVERLGELKLWKLKLKPGKPLAFGRVGDTAFFGLPGNPAAVYVTFAMVVRPWLLRSQGAEDAAPLSLPARAQFELRRAGSRLEFMRARVSAAEGEVRVELHPNQSSGVLSSVSWANALALIPPDTVVARGDLVEVVLLDQLNR